MVFNWLKGAAERKFTDMQRKELVYFIDMLNGGDDEQVALVVDVATNFRNSMSDMCDLRDPITNAGVEIPLELVRHYQQLQKQGMEVVAPGVAVWLHTTRAVHTLANRGHVRQLWHILSRGFPHVEQAAADFELETGTKLDIDGYDEIPIGFEPL